MRTFLKLFLAANLLLARAAAFTADRRDLDLCFKGSGDSSIVGCNRIIEDKRESVANLANAFFNRGTWHNARGRLDEAIRDYSEAIRLEPKQGDRYYIRAHAYREKGEDEKELADHTRAIELSPRALHYIGRGVYWMRKRNYDRAIGDFSAAVRADSKWTNTYYHRARAYQIKGDKKRAIADYRKILELDPSLTFAQEEIRKLGE